MQTESTSESLFSRETAGLPDAVATSIVDLADGARYTITAAPVRKRIGDTPVRMLAYNGLVPGPTLRVQQGPPVTIDFVNQIDLESTIHWHGLRLDNRYDGTHETQQSVPVGGDFTYRVHFPDPGIYWYHPHIREDYGQELGLAGTVIVVPAEADYWAPVHRELPLVLDDLLIEDGQIAPFSRDETTYTAMGRFGNVLLANGAPDLALTAKRGEIVRFFLVNTANARVFNVGATGARMKLVGGDSGRVERESFVESVLLAPSERVIVDVLFDQPGDAVLEQRTPTGMAPLATVAVSEAPASPDLTTEFTTLRADRGLAAVRTTLERYLAAAPDKTPAFVAEMNLAGPADGPAVYTCPMHPEITSDQPASCPLCGMKLLPADLVASAGHEMMHHGHDHHAGPDDHHHEMPEHGMQPGHQPESHDHHGQHAEMPMHHGHGQPATGGIEWEDDMEAVNRLTTPANTQWRLIDRATGAANHAIDWRFRVGDRVKIRLVNEMDSDHPMQHPFHIHGAGRFLVLSRDGAAEENLAWKDTVLVRTGETVDILLEVTNPGVWMAHCHIAEHHESGMMLSFHVTE
jgi:FtsP/CotA-like multicopper oxidase with cupredoxin domain